MDSLCLFDRNKRAPTRTIEQRNMVGARIKIMWEEQLVDPTNEYNCGDLGKGKFLLLK